MKKIIQALILIILTSNFCFCRDQLIKVGLLQSVSSFNLSCDGIYHIYDITAGKTAVVEGGNNYLIRCNDNQIYIGGGVYNSPVRLICDKNFDSLRINGRRYRDTIIIYAKNSRLTVINELDIESYLFGILPKEVNPAWPEESLKAQAVVSRTYALRNLRKHEKDGFDICDQTHCQVFGGKESEDNRSNNAVEATNGEVLLYNGQMAQSLFHASCGGHTENPNNVWSWECKTPEYLEGCKDKYCQNSPHQYWKNKIYADYIKLKLNKAGYNVGVISKIKLSGTSRSGRTKILKIKHSKGELKIAAAKFRMAVDPWQIRSTYLKNISKSGNAFIFSGLGWGHGVGLCQWGAKEMGEKGRDYKEILEHFYPGTTIEKR